MSDVCVITGGSNGMGLEAARFVSKDKRILICGRKQERLERAVESLKADGFDAHGMVCDVSSRKDVHELALCAKELGRIRNVIHAAGMSPSMGEQEQIIRVNAIGTKNVNMEFFKYMDRGSVIVDVASNSAYALPGLLIHHDIYKLAEYEEDEFVAKMVKNSNMAKGQYERAGLAYALSKNFVIWYAQKCAFEYGPKGIRVCSVSPGLIDTDMGQLEKKQGEGMLKFAAEERMGRAEELGFALACAADERNGYLAGVDLLIDGGSTNGRNFRK